jgi:hypothetical protein
MGPLLTNPAVLTVLFGAFGGAIVWLWAQIQKGGKQHRDCEVRVARLETELSAEKSKVSEVQGTCRTLTELLRKEIHLA